ncbi:hypothetical protein D3C81_1037670 [compost metagenome]
MKHVQIGFDFGSHPFSQFLQIGKNSINIMVLLNKLNRCLLANSAYTRIVITRIAHKSLNINNLPRQQLLLFHQAVRGIDHVIPMAFLHNNNAGAVIDELKHIVISGQYKDIHVLAVYRGKGTDAIISLVTFCANVRNAQTVHDFKNNRELGDQIIRCFRAVTFVGCKLLGTEGLASQIPAAGYMGRGEFLYSIPEIPHETIYRIGGETRLGAPDIAAGCGRIKGSEHERHSVYQQ